MQPLEQTGKVIDELEYEGEKDEKLSDAQVEALSKALLINDKFCGKVELEKNGLSDLAVLAISEVLRKPSHSNITKLTLAKNPAFTYKAGEYIGQALLDNVGNSKLESLDFKYVNLGRSGLLRVIDAANQTPTLEKLDVGVLTDEGLKLLA